MLHPMNVLLTGSTGFVGSRLAQFFDQYVEGVALTCVVRPGASTRYGNPAVVEGLTGEIDWGQVLKGQHVVIHAAARAHVMREEAVDPLVEYRKVNVEGTLNLARQALDAGVRRFIYLSSIKVNGESTPLDQPFSAEDDPSPEDAYGVSKMEAEQGLKELCHETGMELVIIRPPLVYGPGVKGNFASMIKLVGKGLPLPLGSVHNKRSLVALDNLVDLIATCIDHPGAANQVFLVSDGHDLSTTELLKGVGAAMGKPARLVPVPPSLLMLTASVLGRKAVAQRLLGSLQVDISRARDVLGWQPPMTVDEGLRRCFTKENNA